MSVIITNHITRILHVRTYVCIYFVVIVALIFKSRLL